VEFTISFSLWRIELNQWHIWRCMTSAWAGLGLALLKRRETYEYEYEYGL
jgi:hypothetical protein